MTIKVISAGFGRTGGTSLKAALEELGFGQCYNMREVIHQPEHARMWNALDQGKTINWQTLFQGYRAVVDWPACAFISHSFSNTLRPKSSSRCAILSDGTRVPYRPFTESLTFIDRCGMAIPSCNPYA